MTVLATLTAVAATAACTVRYTNDASVRVSVCLRFEGERPGMHGNKTLAPGESWEQACPGSNGVDALFALPGEPCRLDAGCPSPEDATCRTYPWELHQGQLPDGKWYGLLGANDDAAGMGYIGSFAAVPYGLRLLCVENTSAHHDVDCDVLHSDDAPKPFCDPSLPRQRQPTTGMVPCDGSQPIQVYIHDTHVQK